MRNTKKMYTSLLLSGIFLAACTEVKEEAAEEDVTSIPAEQAAREFSYRLRDGYSIKHWKDVLKKRETLNAILWDQHVPPLERLVKLRRHMEQLRAEKEQGDAHLQYYLDALYTVSARRQQIEEDLQIPPRPGAAAREDPQTMQAYYRHLFEAEFPTYWRPLSQEEDAMANEVFRDLNRNLLDNIETPEDKAHQEKDQQG